MGAGPDRLQRVTMEEALCAMREEQNIGGPREELQAQGLWTTLFLQELRERTKMREGIACPEGERDWRHQVVSSVE